MTMRSASLNLFRLVSLVMILAFLSPASILGADADLGIPIPGTINGHAIQLFVDTATSGGVILSADAARKIGLMVAPPDPNAKLAPGEVPVGHTEPCTLVVGEIEFPPKIILPVANFRLPEGFSGFLGWPILKQDVLDFQLAGDGLHFVSGSEVPHILAQAHRDMVRVSILNDSPILALEIDGEGGRKGRAIVDTGNWMGLILSPERWKKWVAEDPNRKLRLSPTATPPVTE
jgi:hypothetical protein